jgi:ABC-type dipeptide/oligopeptide/nickel transport system permease subunit
LLSLPGLLLAVVLIARLGPSMTTTLVALGVTGIPTFFRVVRGETLSLAKQPFIEASVALGLPARSIIFQHLLPNLSSSILVLLSMRVGIFLLMGSGLSFIGLGAQPPQSELGALLACGKEYYASAWWTAVFPGISIVLTVLSFNLLGEGLRDRLSI